MDKSLGKIVFFVEEKNTLFNFTLFENYLQKRERKVRGSLRK